MSGRAGLFVTGTDTEVGKTLVAAALIHAYRRAGHTAAGFKPVAAGCRVVDGAWRNEDIDTLLEASSPGVTAEDVNVYLFREAIAPHIAAARAGTQIHIDRIISRFDALAATADVVVVEGAGGFLAPLPGRAVFADLAVALGLPVVLVVGMRLGCINHALLTQEAITARGLTFAGWVANRVAPAMNAYAENLATLDALLPGPRLGEIPFLASPRADSVTLAAPNPNFDLTV